MTSYSMMPEQFWYGSGSIVSGVGIGATAPMYALFSGTSFQVSSGVGGSIGAKFYNNTNEFTTSLDLQSPYTYSSSQQFMQAAYAPPSANAQINLILSISYVTAFTNQTNGAVVGIFTSNSSSARGEIIAIRPAGNNSSSGGSAIIQYIYNQNRGTLPSPLTFYFCLWNGGNGSVTVLSNTVTTYLGGTSGTGVLIYGTTFG